MTLLERAIEAHGGWDVWHRRSSFEVELEAGGVAWPLRLRRRPGLLRGRVRTAEPWTTVSGFPRAGLRGVFEPERVRIEDEDGRVVAERRDPRAAFPGIRRRLRWDDLDFLYFSGYALWNYLAFPFMLARPDFAVEERAGRMLDVRFPAGFPTHSPRQRFHLDADHRLVRHDYTALVFGRWARAAHITGDHREFDGLLVPTRRRVYPRLPGGRVAPGPVIVSLDILSVRASA
jgi:hypothetical protein